VEPKRDNVVALIRTVVCDDETDSCEGIVALSRRDPEIAVVATARNGEEAVEAIKRHAPDLVFLDIQMPRLDGFEVVEHIALRERPVVVFVTAHDGYALRAFELHALDYLVKPFSDARFSAALARAKTVVRQRSCVLPECRAGGAAGASSRPPTD
jgi:two-component system LytT family response regulator